MIEPRAPTSHEGRGRVGGADRVRGAPSVDSAESARTNRARLRARRRAFPSPLRGGVGVGGGGSNSDVRAWARRSYKCLVRRHRALRLRPPPRSAFQAESALPARGRERVAVLRRCFSPSGSCLRARPSPARLRRVDLSARRARRLRRSLPSLLSCGRRPHPCPSPVRERGSRQALHGFPGRMQRKRNATRDPAQESLRDAADARRKRPDACPRQAPHRTRGRGPHRSIRT